MRAVSFVLRIVDSSICLSFTLGEVGYDELDGVNHRTHALCTFVEVIAYGRLEE